jgi:hypothetical protein
MDTIDIEHLINPDQLAVEIADKWRLWHSLRSPWVESTKQLRNYVYATDTTTTANAILPWSNTTTTPKITQISDNLHANYFATLFPQQKWMRWEASTRDSAKREKRDVIQAYMENKVNQSGFINTVSDIVQDWILYGNCFAMVEWEDGFVNKESGEFIQKYTGPRLTRVSPYDICFNPTATSFENSPKVIRSIKSLGEIKRMIDADPSNDYLKEVLAKMMDARKAVRSSEGHIDKGDGFTADGFSNIQQYYESDYVEILTFYGDIYDQASNEFMSDRIITIVDRAYVINNEENPSWLGKSPIFRTPGEKTAFEVQTLQNSASRIFEHKAAHFERTFLEPILNSMLEMARRYMNRSDTIRILDDARGFTKFMDITREDITSSGMIVPVGARHFAERARRVQNLIQMAAVKAQDPTVAPHLSGKELARIIAYELGEPTLFADNISVTEQMETQSKVQDMQAANEERLMEASEMGI